MHKVWLIFSHEFLHTIKRVGFLVLTFTVPLLALLGIGIGHLFTPGVEPPSMELMTLGYVDETDSFIHYDVKGAAKLVRFAATEEATRALTRDEIAEYFVIPSDYESTRVVHRYTLVKEMEPSPIAVDAIKDFLTSNLLTGKVSPEVIALVEAPPNFTVTRLSPAGEVAPDQSGIGSIIIPAAFALLLALSLQISSSYLLQGLGDEKENRLIEVLLSSVSVRQLLTGKVLGLGTAGLLQVLVWLVSAPLLLRFASSAFRGFVAQIHVPPNFVLLGILYFVLGYLLFAVLSVGIGAIAPNSREGQSLALLYTLVGFVPLWTVSLLMIFPRSPLWIVLSIFPVTAPAQMMLRLGLMEIPVWQIGVSVAVLLLAIVGGLWLAVRVFRALLLRTGSRPGLAEIVRNLREQRPVRTA
jgi:ABC-2 type transport system permease protein